VSEILTITDATKVAVAETFARIMERRTGASHSPLNAADCALLPPRGDGRPLTAGEQPDPSGDVADRAGAALAHEDAVESGG
jgi:hypothetical protein